MAKEKFRLAKEKLGLGEKAIETPELLIKKNIMAWDNTMIQLSNISYVSSSEVESLNFPFLAVLLILAGLFLLNSSELLSIILVIAGAVWLFYWYQENERRKRCTILTIRMNSGNNLYFTFSNRAFLTKVMNVLAYIIVNGTDRQVSINMTNCEISGNAQVLTDGIF